MIVCVNDGTNEIVIKRSRFIAISKHIDCRDDVKPFIDGLKQQHPQARHVCYGYISDEKGDEFGYDDNGEPSGTAGKPIYSALAAAGVAKTCIAVVRYFGGIKLGAGGLTRAYRQSAAELIDAVGTVRSEKFRLINIECDGAGYKRVSAAISGCGGRVDNIVYAATVNVTAAVPADFDTSAFGAGIKTETVGFAYRAAVGE